MTLDEWLMCKDPNEMLSALKERASDRKLRLFACACCHRILHFLRDPRSQQAWEIAESFADGTVSSTQLLQAETAAKAAAAVAGSLMAQEASGMPWTGAADEESPTAEAAEAVWTLAWVRNVEDSDYGDGIIPGCSASYAAAENAPIAAARALADEAENEAENAAPSAVVPRTESSDTWVRVYHEERHRQSDLLRDVFGNPFWGGSIDASWRTGAVVDLAQAMYEGRDFSRMPELGGLLESAGCRDQQIVEHCRKEGVHVRGCWVVDLLLGKA